LAQFLNWAQNVSKDVWPSNLGVEFELYAFGIELGKSYSEFSDFQAPHWAPL